MKANTNPKMHPTEPDYKNIKENFYQEQANSLNPLRSWFHNSRHKRTYNFIKKYYKKGQTIIDLGCGNVIWNYDKLPVIGVDINENFLNRNLINRTISQKIVCPIDQINLADNTADIIVITEVLEHLKNLPKILKEIIRLLKPNGIIISSVPYDAFISFWKPLFALQCFFQGKILGNHYYKNKCGHINHFSPGTIKKLLKENNLKIIEQVNHYFFTIFTIAQK